MADQAPTEEQPSTGHWILIVGSGFAVANLCLVAIFYPLLHVAFYLYPPAVVAGALLSRWIENTRSRRFSYVFFAILCLLTLVAGGTVFSVSFFVGSLSATGCGTNSGTFAGMMALGGIGGVIGFASALALTLRYRVTPPSLWVV